MRKLYLPITLLLFIITSQFTFCQPNENARLFPMSLDNYYVYNSQHFGPSGSLDTNTIAYINDTITINGKKYFQCIGFPNLHSFHWYRVDPDNGLLLRYDTLNGCRENDTEFIVDSLSAQLHNQFSRCSFPAPTECTFVGEINIFGLQKDTKNFDYNHSVGSFSIKNYTQYVKDIGCYKYTSIFFAGTGGGSSSYYTLKGCVINGIIYGDTSTTSISLLSAGVPDFYSLHQNYPNPFNPSTRIKFDIPKGSLVRLKVYDMLGREVAELVNEKLAAGVYEYEWNGVGLPSGVYFYKLEAENFVETKRMVLVK